MNRRTSDQIDPSGIIVLARTSTDVHMNLAYQDSPMPQSAAPINPLDTVQQQATVLDNDKTVESEKLDMSDQETDHVLVKIANGDSSAVEECVDLYGGLVWSLARRYCRTTADAEDVTQEVFVQLWEQASRFDPGVASEATFVATIARRRLIDHQRRVGRRREEASDDHFDSIDVWTPLNEVELQDDAAKAARCMDGLAKSQREVLVLSISDGCSHKTISQKLAIPLGTVKSHARRALLQLKRCMSQSVVPSVSGSGS
ncbi:MAG: RNA polymerase sigma factor [Planctomycetota bacterium]